MSDSIIDDIEMTGLGRAKIKVIGVGGAGGNAVQEMIDSKMLGVEFVCANTDGQALLKNGAPIKVQLGVKLTGGLGSGANPEVGRDAAIESIEEIREAIGDADMVFVTAGMGKGTGTGATPIVAQAAKEKGALTVGVVTKPFSYEGKVRLKAAISGLEELKKFVDSLIIIENDRLNAIAPKGTKVMEMFVIANQVLYNAVRGISDVIMRPGLMNVDFADVRTIMCSTGLALMGSGRARGENRAHEAATQAISCPLLQDVSLDNAKAVLYNITAGPDLTGDELSEIGNMIHDAAGEDVNIITGVVFDDAMEDELQVTVIATGIEENSRQSIETVNQPSPSVTPFRQAAAAPKNSAPVRQAPLVASEDDDLQEENRARGRMKATNNWDYDVQSRRYGRRVPQAHAPGQDAHLYDDSEYLDVPAFLRSQAD